MHLPRNNPNMNQLKQNDIIEINSSSASDSNSIEFLDDLIKKPCMDILPGTENVDITFVQESLLDCAGEENADNINSSHDCSNDIPPEVDEMHQGNMSAADFEWLTERNEKRRRGRPRKARPIFNSAPSENKKPKRSNKRAKPKTRSSRTRKATATTAKKANATSVSNSSLSIFEHCSHLTFLPCFSYRLIMGYALFTCTDIQPDNTNGFHSSLWKCSDVLILLCLNTLISNHATHFLSV